ncbi:MAG: DUF4248 domain-containing protein [Chitinophagaceae bacterium]
MKAETSTKTQLAKQYKVHYSTFIKWLQLIPDLNLSTKQRSLTPKQVQLIYNHLGEP